MKYFITFFTRYMLCMGILNIVQLNAQPTTIVYCHGILDNATQSKRFQAAFPADSSLVALNFADSLPATGYNFNALIGYCAGMTGKTFNRNAMYMGQTNDLAVIATTLAKCDQNTSIVAYGCSRGAAAWVTYIGQHNPENIKALVLDACPADMVQNIHPQLAKLGLPLNFDYTTFQICFPAYPNDAISPLQSIKNIQNKNLPILLITSKTDSVVDWTNSLKLYQEFKDNNFTNVHLLIIPNGRHSFILQDCNNADYYLHGIHSFYHHYNIAYNPDYITQNPFTIISKSEIEQLIQTYQQNLEIQQANTRTNFSYALLLIALTTLTFQIIHSSKNI